MSSINNVCDCGRKRGSMNEKNWSRHNEFCKIKKIKLSHNINIKEFFCSVNSKCVVSNQEIIETVVDDGNTVIANDIALNTLQSKKANEDSNQLFMKTVIDLEKCYSEEPNNFVLDNSLATTKFQNDPVFYIGKTISPGLKLTLLELGPCQPKDIDLPGGKFPHDSSIPSLYCWTCKLFGTPRAQKGLFASSGCNSWGHLSGIHGRLYKHETCKDHLEAELNRVMYINNNRIDLQLTKSSNTQVAANREVVKVLMDIVVCLAKHNSALRGHLESANDNIQGQFLDWVNLFSKYHPVLRAHLDRIQSSSKKTRLSFMSKGSQNAMLECIAETIRKKILNENHNPNALHVWCFAHCLNLAVCDACEATAEVQDFFGTVRSLVKILFKHKMDLP
ncbi:unnamed protein product [Macrosiphum euphorbiae]|uniref:DUF4371 domain-containing protein n=1 Tax=Macrosiphum euphorbiae TaxID=13131 RepID=A0AAV0XVT9_9HEMI|nr:unnamed protein product [Macrosiphum euphorbiae]